MLPLFLGKPLKMSSLVHKNYFTHASKMRWGSKNPKWQGTAGYGFNQVDEYKGMPLV